MYLIGNRYKIEEDDITTNKLYKAYDTFCNEVVFVNIIEDNKYIAKNFLENLIDEMTQLKNIKFPGILDIKDVGIHEKYYYIVSPYYSGMTLDKMIKQNFLNRKYIIKIFNKILKTFEFVSNNNIYHGSLTPEFIIVDNNFNIKIANFGIVKANNGVNIRSEVGRAYLSPSQICINYTDIQSDFYSLGIILFECVFSKLPYEIYEDDEKMLKTIDKGVDYSRVDLNDIDKDIINIIDKLLSRKDKYIDVKDIIVDITGLMYSEVNKNNKDILEEKDDELVRKKRRKIRYNTNKIIFVIIIIITIISSFVMVLK